MPATVQLEFFGGRWNLKKYFGQFFFNFKTHSQQHVDVQVIFEKCYPNSTWPPEVNSKIFCGRKNFNTERLKLFKFYNHTPHNMEMCMWFFKVLPKFKMAAMYDSLYKWVIIHLV